MASPFAAPIMEGAREAAWEHQCVVEIISTRNNAPMEQAAIESLMSRPIAGIIYATPFTREVTPPALPADTPLVLLDCYDAKKALTSAVPDDCAAAHALTRSKVNAGHRRIAHMAGESVLDGFEEAGIAVDQELMTCTALPFRTPTTLRAPARPVRSTNRHLLLQRPNGPSLHEAAHRLRPPPKADTKKRMLARIQPFTAPAVMPATI